MALIKLFKDEVAEGRLPGVCMVCGETATIDVKKKFSWYPQWALFVGGVILASIYTKRMTIYAPMCEQHKSHWSFRLAIIWISLAGVLLVGLGAFALLMAFNKPNTSWIGGFACAGAGFLGLVWLIAIIVLQNTAIHPKEITKDTITLNRVSQIFVDAVEAEGQAEEKPQVKKVKGSSGDKSRPVPKDAADKIQRRGGSRDEDD